jgi:hypothetical protein
MLDLNGLFDLLNEHSFIAIQCSTCLDVWTGLVSFEDVYDLIHGEELYLAHANKREITHLELKLKIDIVLRQLTDRFILACPYAREVNELRQSPAFVVMPAGEATAIAGIVFKLSNNGTTYICFPYRYLKFWKLWLEMQNEEISDVIQY